MKRIKIFKSGTRTTAAGQTIEFSDADLVACAAAYDPATSEAPIVIGHPKTDAPAYGWIAGLIAEDGALFADLDRVNPAFAEAVNGGAYRHVSAAFYGPHNPANPKPGAYYLRHVGFLGATPPAVKGLGAVEFAAGEADVVAEIDFAESETEARGDGGAFPSSSPAQSGALDPDRTSPAAEGESTGANTAIAEAAPDSAALTDAPAGAPKNETELVERLAELEARARALDEREQKLAALEAAQKRAEVANFAEGLVRAGRLLPRDQAGVVEFLLAIPEGEIAFAEGESTRRVEPAAWLREFLGRLPVQVEFRELSPAPRTPQVISPAEAVQRTKDLVARENAAGRAITYTEAAARVARGDDQ
ncbi:MAG: hypothetical protein IKC51_02935 [Myxococcaceae bacterium]|nr:hypothetical protein [Myxococcaceae bacterium]